MSMNIGAVIKKLRQERGMVQEQVAEYLNVSTQAVSRWETGSALPDITQVPAIANLFNCSSDMLLGVDVAAMKERIEAIIKEAGTYILKKRNDEAEEMLRAALKEYPNSYEIMGRLAFVLFNSSRQWGNEAEQRTLHEEIIVLCEKILAECTDDKIRYGAIQDLCLTHIRMGETEKAAALANRMPEKHLSRENLIFGTLTGAERYRHMQNRIANDMMYALQDILLLNVVFADRTAPYNLDESTALNHKILDIIDILFENGDYGDYNWLLASAHMNLAYDFRQRDVKTALNHFRLAAKHTILYDADQNSMPIAYEDISKEYTNLLFRGIKCPLSRFIGPTNKSKDFLDRSYEFDSVFPASELEEIRTELRKYATV